MLNNDDWICGEIDLINETKRIKETYVNYKDDFKYLISNKMNLPEEILRQELKKNLNNYKNLLVFLLKHIDDMKKTIKETEQKYSDVTFPF